MLLYNSARVLFSYYFLSSIVLLYSMLFKILLDISVQM